MSQEIIELQTRVQFQDDAIQQLDDAVIRQNTLIEQLRGRIEQLEDRVKYLAASSPGDKTPDQEKPPHY